MIPFSYPSLLWEGGRQAWVGTKKKKPREAVFCLILGRRGVDGGAATGKEKGGGSPFFGQPPVLCDSPIEMKKNETNTVISTEGEPEANRSGEI